MWLKEQKSDIIFLQETYSTAEVEDILRTQWQSKLFFSHGTCHSCGVMVLVRGDLDFNLSSIRTDDEGRYIVLEAEGYISRMIAISDANLSSMKLKNH